MQINGIQNFTSTKANTRKNVSFNGMRRVLALDNVDSFLKTVQYVGDVVIQKRVPEKGWQTLVPSMAALVKAEVPDKYNLNGKRWFFSLFEKGFEKSDSVKSLDAKELGLMEAVGVNLKTISMPYENTPDYKSFSAVKRAYDKAVEVFYLTSYEGDKYRGIGTRLLDVAFDLSKQLKYGGKVFLYSLNKIPAYYTKNSDYCWNMRKKMPTEFYYKYGFRADSAINRYMQDGYFPDSITMHLPKNTISHINKTRKEYPVIVPKDVIKEINKQAKANPNSKFGREELANMINAYKKEHPSFLTD